MSLNSKLRHSNWTLHYIKFEFKYQSLRVFENQFKFKIQFHSKNLNYN
jgi:hypothetical protein